MQPDSMRALCLSWTKRCDCRTHLYGAVRSKITLHRPFACDSDSAHGRRLGQACSQSIAARPSVPGRWLRSLRFKNPPLGDFPAQVQPGPGPILLRPHCPRLCLWCVARCAGSAPAPFSHRLPLLPLFLPPASFLFLLPRPPPCPGPPPPPTSPPRSPPPSRGPSGAPAPRRRGSRPPRHPQARHNGPHQGNSDLSGLASRLTLRDPTRQP